MKSGRHFMRICFRRNVIWVAVICVGQAGDKASRWEEIVMIRLLLLEMFGPYWTNGPSGPMGSNYYVLCGRS